MTDASAKYSERSGGQVVLHALLGFERSSHGWAIRIGVTFLASWVPLILLLAKRNHRDLPGEGCLPSPVGIVKHDTDLLGMIVVFVDEH